MTAARKVVLRAAGGAAAILLLAFLARDHLARKAIEVAVRHRTGFPLDVEKVSVHLLRARLQVEGISLHNPPAFPDDRFVRVSSLRVDYDPRSLLGGASHVRELRISVDQVVVVTNAQGQVNSDLLAQSLSSGDAAPKRRPYRVDLLRLHVGKLVTEDFSRGARRERVLPLDLDVTERDLSESTDLTGVIARAALGGLGTRVGGVTRGIGKAARGAGRGAEAAGKGVLGIFHKAP